MFLYPFGDFHSLNLGWFLLQFKDWTEKIQEYLDNGGGTSENLANVIAPVFNAANYYSAGDYVLYNNELYKANQAVNPGTWDPSAWTQCLIVDEMGTGGGGAGVDNVARLMIAGQYSASFAYQKYGICRYNDKLWMCNTNLPSGGEAWNPAHWDEITVGAGLTGLRRSVDTLSGSITALNTALNKIKGHLIIVGQNNADFNNLADAIAYAKETYNVLTEDVTIFVRSGIYNISYREDSTENEPEAIEKGANRISIIGENRDTTIFQITNTPARANGILGVGGECSIENLTFKCLFNDDGSTSNYKRAYCIHNDYGYNYSYDTPYVTKIKNCKLYSECFNPIGGGLWQNQTQIYEECEFIWNPQSSLWTDNGAFYVHAPADNTATVCALIVRDCEAYAAGQHYGIFLGNVTGSIGFSTIPVTIERSIFKNGGNHSIANFNKADINLQTLSELNSLDAANTTYNKGINVISEIDSSESLNTFYAVYQAGLYYVNHAQNAPYPYGMLFVMPFGQSICFQLFFSTSGLDVFVRSRTGSSWSNWLNVVKNEWLS